MIGTTNYSLFNITQNQCICQLIQSNNSISSLNYFPTNQTCQLFYSSTSSITIQSYYNSFFIFMNQSSISLTNSQTHNLTSTSTASTTTPAYQTMNSVAENTVIKMQCTSPTPTINVVNAYYGVQNSSVCDCTVSYCTQMNVTQTVISYCAKNGSPSTCTFTVGNSIFPDTCHNVVKTFWLTYFCN
ncbi:unnamed protein product [Adineta steineri]|uniref:SUEL-type lectin domain-containing protein n=2 Tax=Adineta steineri TaxID=433720 RepID=A0A819CXS4_9BILA|nr:unnamed protein product [Adineta steineri]CAF3825782.1 unnamed protein product [Adineta steineri]